MMMVHEEKKVSAIFALRWGINHTHHMGKTELHLPIWAYRVKFDYTPIAKSVPDSFI